MMREKIDLNEIDLNQISEPEIERVGGSDIRAASVRRRSSGSNLTLGALV